MTKAAIGNAFLAHQSSPGVYFSHNDHVRVVSGPYSGEYGSLIGILTLEPEPVFMLESESAGDIQVTQSHIQIVK
jgi:hypothetical protein